MSPTDSSPPQPTAENPLTRFDLWLAVAALLSVWLVIWNQQRLEWSVNPLYSYGWFIPALAAYLIYERSRTAPPPRFHGSRFFAPPFLLLAAVLIPARIIQEAHPDWVRINWMMAAIALAATFLLFFAWGGVRWCKHFAFPILFTLTALPWPVWFETFAQQELMRYNTIVSAECLTLAAGMPAFPVGNTIYIGNTSVDVEEACSGIRSLQTAFMMSLFFGEFFLLGWFRRIILVVSSFIVAFLLNMGRTMALTYIAGTEGPSGLDEWHDPLGNAVMFGCIAALWGLAALITPKAKKASAPAEPTNEKASPVLPKLPRLSPAAMIAFIGLVATAEALTAGYYWMHERKLAEPIRWHLALPEKAPNFLRSEFPERTLAILKFNSGDSGRWDGDDGKIWFAYYLRWEPGRVSKFLSGSHNPDVCMPASGYTKIGDLGFSTVEVGPLRLPFKGFLFESPNGQRQYTFHCLIQDRPAADGEDVDFRQVSADERIDSVLAGNRNLGQRVIGISIRNVFDAEEARSALADELQKLIQFE